MCVCVTCIRVFFFLSSVCSIYACKRGGQKRPGNNEISANVRGTGKLRRYTVGGRSNLRKLFNDSRSRLPFFDRPSAGVYVRFIIYCLCCLYSLKTTFYTIILYIIIIFVRNNCSRPYIILLYNIIYKSAIMTVRMLVYNIGYRFIAI